MPLSPVLGGSTDDQAESVVADGLPDGAMFERSFAFVILVTALFGVSHWLGAAQDGPSPEAKSAVPETAPGPPAPKEPRSPPPREADHGEDEREPDPPVKEKGKKKGLLPILSG